MQRCQTPERYGQQNPEELVKQYIKGAQAEFTEGSMRYEFNAPLKLGDRTSSGSIVVVVDPKLLKEWRTIESSVGEQLNLACSDLFLHDMHGWIALTPDQEIEYVDDLEQSVQEALNRTTFSKLNVHPLIKWHVTVVHSTNPPYLTLVISIHDSPRVLTAQ